MQYAPPAIEDLGSIAELTADFNKKGHKPDMYSNVVPIVGSIIVAP